MERSPSSVRDSASTESRPATERAVSSTAAIPSPPSSRVGSAGRSATGTNSSSGGSVALRAGGGCIVSTATARATREAASAPREALDSVELSQERVAAAALSPPTLSRPSSVQIKPPGGSALASGRAASAATWDSSNRASAGPRSSVMISASSSLISELSVCESSCVAKLATPERGPRDAMFTVSAAPTSDRSSLMPAGRPLEPRGESASTKSAVSFSAATLIPLSGVSAASWPRAPTALSLSRTRNAPSAAGPRFTSTRPIEQWKPPSAIASL
mmetsp:Transcript_6498/g.18724  ORF Transcript_6498/g.18724 Transcript_6498/m.18724 type:complete len:274 (-) Transcript_6498:281-1102(-)